MPPLPRAGACFPTTRRPRNPRRYVIHRADRRPPPRPDTIALPYNLYWGDSQNRLASLFAGVGAKVINKKPDGPAEVWTVDGLIAPNLQTSLFTFTQGNLVALEFDYGQADWTPAHYGEVMDQFRKLLEAKCEKPGEVIDRPAVQGTRQHRSANAHGLPMEARRYARAVVLFLGGRHRQVPRLPVHQRALPLPGNRTAGPRTAARRRTCQRRPQRQPAFWRRREGGPRCQPPAAAVSPSPSLVYGPPPPPTPTPKPGTREADPLPER